MLVLNAILNLNGWNKLTLLTQSHQTARSSLRVGIYVSQRFKLGAQDSATTLHVHPLSIGIHSISECTCCSRSLKADDPSEDLQARQKDSCRSQTV